MIGHENGRRVNGESVKIERKIRKFRIVEDISSARPHLHNTNERYTPLLIRDRFPPGECQYKHGPVCPGASVYRVTLNLFIVKIVTRCLALQMTSTRN